MSETVSAMLALGVRAPDFELPDVVSGRKVSLSGFRDKQALLVMFICRHCPYVRHVKAELARLGRDYAAQSLAVVGISSNDAQAYPDDSPDQLKRFAQEEGFVFPLCYDESQAVARDYTAACTPDFFLFDRQRKLVYRGQIDDSRPGNDKPVTGRDLRAAIDAVLRARSVSPDQKPSLGCGRGYRHTADGLGHKSRSRFRHRPERRHQLLAGSGHGLYLRRPLGGGVLSGRHGLRRPGSGVWKPDPPRRDPAREGMNRTGGFRKIVLQSGRISP